MTVRLVIGFLCCLCGMFCRAAISQLEAEDTVRRRVVQRGLHVGFDAEKGAYIVIASASKSGCDSSSSAYCAQRVACFRLAELKAIHQIIDMRLQMMTGSSEVLRERLGNDAVKTASTFVETFSRMDMDGCVILDSCALNEGAKCVVAMAMVWSEDLKRSARASAAGTIRPAAAWVEELKCYLGKWDDGLLPPTVAFVDSAGFFHRLGVGTASLGGDSLLDRNAAARLADMWARKNLQLALYGYAAMRRKAELMKTSSSRRELNSLASAYEALGDVAAEGPLPAGSTSILDAVVTDSSNSGKLLVVVYGVKTQEAVEGAADSVLQNNPKGTAGIMIFNPITGKFEKK